LYVAGEGPLQKRDAQGNWSLLAELRGSAVALDTTGDLYVAGASQLQMEDTRASWSVALLPGEVAALAVDMARNVYVALSATGLAGEAVGSLYVADYYFPSQAAADGRVRKRDTQGNWSLLGAGEGTAPGQFHGRPGGLAVDGAGNLYVADTGNNRMQKYTPGP